MHYMVGEVVEGVVTGIKPTAHLFIWTASTTD